MYNKRRFFLLGFLFWSLSILLTQPVFAASKNGGVESDIGVSVLYPDNQLKKTGEAGYFDLRVEPEKKQTLQVEVTNYANKEVNVDVQLNRGLTNENGLVDYTKGKKSDKFLLNKEINFYEIASIKDKKIKIPPSSKRLVDVSLELSKKSFEGTILGGLFIKQADKLTEEEKKKQVINTFGYAVPIMLTESDKEIENKLNLGDIKPALRNYHPFIEAELINKAPTLVRKLKIDARITKKGSKDALYVKKDDQLQMAPESMFKFGFDLKDTPLSSGKYQLKMLVDADGKPYTFEKNFTITKEKAKEYNNEAVYLEKENDNTWLYILGLIVAVLITIFVTRKFSNKKEAEKNSDKTSENETKKEE